MPDTDGDLMRTLHDEHASALWSFVVSLTGDPVAAQDVVQETLLRAWRHPEVLDPATGSPRGWLFTVARHLVIDDWRSRRTRPETVTDSVPELATTDTTDRALQSWVVLEALGRLSADHRAVLAECYYGGRSIADAARTLGIAEGTVKSRTHYALLALRVVFQEMGVTR